MDGVSLTSVAHPKSAWYRRMWFWLRRPRLSEDSLETVEIDIREPAQGDRILNYIFSERRVDEKKTGKAPCVTLEHIESIIAMEWYTIGSTAFARTAPIIGPAYLAGVKADIIPLSRLTLCVLQLRNGFLVTGESVCVAIENFDEAKGRELARQNAIDKVWALEGALEGYLFKERLYRCASGTANSVP